VTVLSPFLTVGELQGAALCLITGRVRVRRIIGKIETLQRHVTRARLPSEDEPSLFLLRAGIQKLELRIRDPAIACIHGGWLRTVALANDLD